MPGQRQRRHRPQDNPPVLEAIRVDPALLPVAPDARYEEELDAFDRAHIEYLNECVEHLRNFRSLRKTYANRVYWFMIIWNLFVGFVVLAQGFGIGGFHLSTTVLTTLVGGTTVSVLGLVGFVVKGLFPANPNHMQLPTLPRRTDP